MRRNDPGIRRPVYRSVTFLSQFISLTQLRTLSCVSDSTVVYVSYVVFSRKIILAKFVMAAFLANRSPIGVEVNPELKNFISTFMFLSNLHFRF
jgi:hypothetical protein